MLRTFGFRDVLDKFIKNCGQLKDDLLRAMAKLLELVEKALTNTG